ncbi:MAG: DUF4136 domain-containing protein [Proteobacteria bacterium]|nr:DUF4136 domain-containing protein [Pseudomonadota bacterium]
MTTLQTIPGIGFYKRLLSSPVAVVGLVLAVTALSAGCASAPTKSAAMIDPQADFGDYKTFTWHTSNSAEGADEPMSLVDSSIRAAITTEMQRKGYAEAPAGSTGDLLIDFEAAQTEKVKSSPFRIGVGVGSYGSGVGGSVGTSTSGVKNISEGSLVIHAIDPTRNAEVRRSRVSRELGKGSVNPDVVQSVVAEILSDFPTRTATP